MQKLLIISNNCLSKYNSNGRTLLNLLGEFPVSSLYQLYISNELPLEQYCQEYYRVTDKDIVKSYCKFKGKYSFFTSAIEAKDVSVSNVNKKRKKSPFSSLVRDIVWKNCIFSKKSILRWVKGIKVDAILLQAGDNVLLCDLAKMLSKKCNLPLIIYNTEDYYFKNYDYIKKKKGQGLVYWVYHSWVRRVFRKTMRVTCNYIYNCEGLKKLYDEEFQTNGYVIYNVTDFKRIVQRNEAGIISYAGNLGCGRHKTLLKVAEALQSIDKNLSLDVYGPTTDTQVLNDFANSQAICYHGCVSYAEVCEVMKNSRLLVHVESFDDYYKRDTRYAFSTKLADYMASNIPVFLCAPLGNESYEYMKKNSCAFLANDHSEIDGVLRSALLNSALREKYAENALKTSEKNHCFEKNGRKFREIIIESIEEYGHTNNK